MLIGCKTADNDSDSTFFGGEIINPKSSFVLFLKDDQVIDTLKLDENNQFLKEFDDIEEGLYTFKHGNEFQYMYLEPADSILVRLNTWDFDESLVFSGKGSSKNEFLINLFLQNEMEEKAMSDFYRLEEEPFQEELDSLLNVRLNLYNEFTQNEESITEGFDKLINVAIHFTLYRLKEIYPLYHKWDLKKDYFPDISEEFYSFRKSIDLNDENLTSYYPYRNYIISRLYHLSYQLAEMDPSKDDITVNILNEINKNIHLENFRNNLLKSVFVNDFLKSGSTCSINEKALAVFLESCTNEESLKHVKDLVNDSQHVVNDQPLESFEVMDYQNVASDINDLIAQNNALIYFWSTDFMSSEYMVNRILYLEKKHPDIKFIGINVGTAFEDVSREPHLKKLNISNQFKLTESSKAHHFLTSNYPRVILVNKNGIVTNGFTYLDSKLLHNELKKLEIH